MRKLWAILTMMFGLLISPTITQAQEISSEKVLIIQSGEEPQSMKEQKILEIILGQYDVTSETILDTMMTKEKIKSASAIIYLGSEKKQLSKELIEELNTFSGKFYAIGHNVEQIPRMSWLNLKGEVIIQHLVFSEKEQALPEERIIYKINVQLDEIQQVAMTTDGTRVPLIAKQANNYYFAAETLSNPFGTNLAESFQSFFNKQPTGFVRYLRLEDIHPKVDAKQLREQAEFLKEKEIPYMVAVIPVYTNENGETIHFSDVPELVETLKYMQKNGASIVLHGYRHQYRESETGEGFEFWDVENDRPIYQKGSEKAKQRTDFATEKDYQQFINEGEAFERKYITAAIENGVAELVTQGIYPLAFEAPHYAMSQQGYEVVSRHFSTYIGRIQISDETYKSEYQPSNASRPAFLHGMTVYPETIGFVEQNNEQSLQLMKNQVTNLMNYQEAYISAFYHPYLGIDGLKDVVDILGEVNAPWLDLKAENNQVTTSTIKLSSEKGQIQVEKLLFESKHAKKEKMKRIVIYGIILVGIVGSVLVFIIRRKTS
ncbi:DUF2334 domain-containing protein [Enterococcus saccharolyticus]|uniref:DUF2334 domain-containing protein n=1 Tax=Enterococcus saccharolyticus TaxID=41997 RepID=UPI001E56C815|nr:DUF2334 domain-containing protein [Enterococcus saccharolyticus]MCD5001069.1 DUF2334 domain-containing protein [Enterococcus saccharolyticus]